MIKIGEEIASGMKREIARQRAEYGELPALAIVLVGDNPASRKFVEQMKMKFASDVGIDAVLHEYPADINVEDLVTAVKGLASSSEVGGIIVQLPLPAHFDRQTTQAVLDAVPPALDVDALSTEGYARFVAGTSSALPGVAGAVKEILEYWHVDLATITTAVVFGRGPLVGKPVADWLRRHGIEPTVVHSQNINDPSVRGTLQSAAHIVSGIGKPHFLQPHMFGGNEGTTRYWIDGGTSGSGGKLVGDIDPIARCTFVASEHMGLEEV